MNLLLDTCSLLWAMTEPNTLSVNARKALRQPANSITVSTVSFWEITLKHSIGKLELEGIKPEDFPDLVREEGWTILPLDAESAAGFGLIKKVKGHQDPFDRMLIHLAISQNYSFVSKDAKAPEYLHLGLKVCW